MSGGTAHALIPRNLHQIWLGPREPPRAWLETWRRMNPTWTYLLWREDDIAGFGLRNGSLFQRLVSEGIWDAASDVARIEILHRYGGVYADADSRALRPLDGAYFLDAGFFATREIPPTGRYFVTNAFMGCIRDHPIAARYIAHLSRARIRCIHGSKGTAFCCAWRTTGPLALMGLLRGTDALVLEPSVFFTHTIKGDEVPGEGWAEHFWSSTGERSPLGQFPGARSYEEAV